jgi:hypothetical protein
MQNFLERPYSPLCFERSIYEVDVDTGIPSFVPLVKTYRNLTIHDLCDFANSGEVHVDKEGEMMCLSSY